LGKGDGSFYPAVAFGSAGYGAESVAVADLNGDGSLDVLVANCAVSGQKACGSRSKGTIGVLINNSSPMTPSAATTDFGFAVAPESNRVAPLRK